MAIQESWYETRAKLEKVDISSQIDDQDTQEKQHDIALKTINTLQETGHCEFDPLLQFYDTHLPEFPKSLDEFRKLSIQRQVFLLDPVRRLKQAFGPQNYKAVYREWKSMQATTTKPQE